jgi:LPS export ABC transporter protein LptC
MELKLFAKKGVFRTVFILALLSLVGTGCENDIEKVKLVTDHSREAVETSEELEILYSDSAKVKLKLTAPVLERYHGDKPYTELKKGVKVEFYDDDMKVISTLTAGYAIRHDTESMMEARTNVIIVNQKGERLNTEKLIWNERTAKIYSDSFVRITTADKVIFGNGFEANQDFTNYRIYKIKGTINISGNEYSQNP